MELGEQVLIWSWLVRDLCVKMHPSLPNTCSLGVKRLYNLENKTKKDLESPDADPCNCRQIDLVFKTTSQSGQTAFWEEWNDRNRPSATSSTTTRKPMRTRKSRPIRLPRPLSFPPHTLSVWKLLPIYSPHYMINKNVFVFHVVKKYVKHVSFSFICSWNTSYYYTTLYIHTYLCDAILQNTDGFEICICFRRGTRCVLNFWDPNPKLLSCLRFCER